MYNPRSSRTIIPTNKEEASGSDISINHIRNETLSVNKTIRNFETDNMVLSNLRQTFDMKMDTTIISNIFKKIRLIECLLITISHPRSFKVIFGFLLCKIIRIHPSFKRWITRSWSIIVDIRWLIQNSTTIWSYI
jgi:hypothetical protein